MVRMTPEEEAAYALDWDLPRRDLDPAVQVEYDRLKREREARPQGQAAAPRETKPEPPAPGRFPWRWYWRRTGAPPFDVPLWLVIPVVIAWAVLFIWLSEGVNISGDHMNFRTLRSDISKIQLPAGYAKMSSSESGTDCRERRCKLTEFWVRGTDGAYTAAEACRDVRRAMETGLQGVQADVRPYIPRGAACDYYTSLDSFFHPGDGKRFVEAIVWVHGEAKGSSGGYRVELFAAYNYWSN